jgi:hypothetical protein
VHCRAPNQGEPGDWEKLLKFSPHSGSLQTLAVDLLPPSHSFKTGGLEGNPGANALDLQGGALGFLVLAFQAGLRTVRDETKCPLNLSCAERGTGLDHERVSFQPFGRAILERDWWRYPLWIPAFPYGFKPLRAAIGRGCEPQSKWDGFRVWSSI